jgi:hypothetical protein
MQNLLLFFVFFAVGKNCEWFKGKDATVAAPSGFLLDQVSSLVC